jgi:hypothetical protein
VKPDEISAFSRPTGDGGTDRNANLSNVEKLLQRSRDRHSRLHLLVSAPDRVFNLFRTERRETERLDTADLLVSELDL